MVDKNGKHLFLESLKILVRQSFFFDYKTKEKVVNNIDTYPEEVLEALGTVLTLEYDHQEEVDKSLAESIDKEFETKLGL